MLNLIETISFRLRCAGLGSFATFANRFPRHREKNFLPPAHKSSVCNKPDPFSNRALLWNFFFHLGEKIAADDLWIDSTLSAIFVKEKQFRSLAMTQKGKSDLEGDSERILPTHSDSAETRERRRRRFSRRRGSLRFAISFLSPSSCCVCLCH